MRKIDTHQIYVLHLNTHTHTQLLFQSMVACFYHSQPDVCICLENFMVNELNKIRTLCSYLKHLPLRNITTQAKVDNKHFRSH